MTYQRPEVVQCGAAISAIQAGFDKDGGNADNQQQTTFTLDAYRSDD